MKELRVFWAEVLGLFLDDGRLAGAILAWLVLCWIAAPRLGLSGGLPCVVLFAGLAGILLESAFRGARRGS